MYHYSPECVKPAETVLIAELIGDNTATACGIAVRSSSPVLALCRELIAARLDPDAVLIAYRRGIAALHVRSIGTAATLEINSRGTGFTRARAVRAAPSMRPRTDSDPGQGGQP
jgi:hypothetical protein